MAEYANSRMSQDSGFLNSGTVMSWCTAESRRVSREAEQNRAVGEAIAGWFSRSFSDDELLELGEVARRAVEAENESETKG